MLLEAKIAECLKAVYLLQGHFDFIKKEKEITLKKVKTAKKWLSRQPDYLKFLQHLQSILHQKNIGLFSELLTSFVKDVLKKDKDIVFDLYTYHGLPALKIEAINNGCRESIYDGSGGSIANIVSTGLRLIALSRLPHRKFIVLDEPDCWLKPDHIPVFAKIIGEISKKLKIQTIIISHHDWKYFKDYGRVIELTYDGKNLKANIVHENEFEETDDDYVKSIRLKQFMSHFDTEFKLHPYLTCLIGENDIGKSALSTAVKAVSYNDSSDSYIKHHTNEAQVLFELSKKRQILWQRFRVTTQENPQKVKYSLFVDGRLIASEFNSNDVPKFISKELNIFTSENIDIHVGNQKQPVFLLSSDIKPQERAKILSLGKESIIIQKMMENIKDKTRQNKQIVKDGEEKYAILDKQIQILSNIDDLIKKTESIKNSLFVLEKQKQDIIELNDILNNLSKIATISSIENCINHIQEPLLKDCNSLGEFFKNFQTQYKLAKLKNISYEIEEINLKDTSELEKIIKRLSLAYAGASINKINIEINEPVIHNFDELKIIINNLESYKKYSKIELINHSIEQDFFIKDTNELEKLILELEQIQLVLKDCEEKQRNLKMWEKKINKEIEAFLGENKYICPTCKQNINKEHFCGNLK